MGGDDLQDLLLESEDIHDFLGALTVYLGATLTRPDAEAVCSVTLLRDGMPVTVASSGPLAAAMDEIQYAKGDGPCLTAARNRVTAVVQDVDGVFPANHHWADYLTAAAGHGIRSILAVPFLLEGEAQAALNLYSPTPGAFTPEDIATAEWHAAQASPVLRIAVRAAQLTDTTNHLLEARESRTMIDLAVGIIMVRNRCSQKEAFQALQRASASRKVLLRVLAAGIVNEVSRPDLGDHPLIGDTGTDHG
jgi:GAF domain-containing protein